MSALSYIQQNTDALSVRLVNRLNQALHKDLQADNEIRYRARMLLLLAYLFASLVSLLSLILLFSPLALAIKALGLLIWSALFVTVATVHYLLQVRAAFWFAAHLLLLSTVALCYTGIAVTGGVSVSPVTELLLFFPLISFYLMGTRKGLLWSLVNTLLLILFFVMESLGFTFVNVLPAEFMVYASGLIYVSGILSLFLMVLIYENTLTVLQAQQQKSHSQVRYLATHDKLTGIANRALFYQALDSSISKHQRQGAGQQLALLYMDLVGFKEINDRYGHHTGDVVLQGIARNLQAGIRATDLVARHGGDEFVVLLKMVKDEAALEQLADKIADLVSTPIDVVGLTLQVFPSMGIAFLPMHADDALNLERCADQAMYEAKAQQRDWKIYQGAISSRGRGEVYGT